MRICKETISFLGLLLCVAHLTAGTITPQSQILKSEVADVNNDKQPDIILLTAQNGKEQLEIYRRQIEDELNNLTWELDKELGMPYIPKGTLPKKKRTRS